MSAGERAANARAVLFRVDAGAAIGLGHAARCSTLATALAVAGWRPVFLTASAEAWRDLHQAHAYEFREVGSVVPGSDGDAEATARHAADLAAESVVIDGYAFGPAFGRAFRRENVLWIDDLGFDDERAGRVLNANLFAEQRLYPKVAEERLLLGSSFALLRSEFAALRERPRPRSEVPRILVTLGGSDPPDVGSKVLAAIDILRERRQLVMRMLVGSANPRARELAKRDDVVIGAPNVAEHMRWCDVAITAAGGTCLELACLGVPGIAIAIADNQRGVAAVLERRGMMQSLGWHADVSPRLIADATEALLYDRTGQMEMVMRQRREVDGLGAQRVVERLFASAR